MTIILAIMTKYRDFLELFESITYV